MISASSPGKIILFGEHAVVYGRPAIAAPVSQVRATAHVADSTQVELHLVDLDRMLLAPDSTHPLGKAIELVRAECGLSDVPPVKITIESTIPIASGLGSGAAIASALIRALHTHWQAPPDNATVNRLTYEIEKIFHGTPSGIDNTVVTYERPVYFRRAEPTNLIAPFTVKGRVDLLIADTGVKASTKAVVGDLRGRWAQARARYEIYFDQCATIVEKAKAALEQGDLPQLGRLMDANQAVLAEMGVSSAALETLIASARTAGAYGAKLSGAGGGGNLIALVDPADSDRIRQTLLDAGARRVIATTLE